MSYICDWCGEEIFGSREGRGVATISASGLHADRGLVSESAGHFHTGRSGDEDSCVLQALCAVADHCKTSLPMTPRQERARAEAERKEAQRIWQRMPRARRESLLFHVLGDDALILRELTARVNAELGYPAARDGQYRICAVHESEIRSLVKRLSRDGHLRREPETFNKTHTRYRYFRKRGLDGPIVDLERAYNDDSEAVA